MTSATPNTNAPATDPNGGGRRHSPALVGLFEGYGGLSEGVLAGLGLGGHVAAVAEIEPSMCRVLAHHFPDVPNLGDVTTIDWEPWRGRVDVMVGGFPCQDVSLAGRGAGLVAGVTRSGLWSEFARGIDETRPRVVVAENVRGLLSAPAGDPVDHSSDDDEGDGVTVAGGVQLRALGAVLGDLASMGYDAEWAGVRAADVGAPHLRFRVFVLAFPAEQAEPVPASGVAFATWAPSRGVWERADGQLDLFADTVDVFDATWPASGSMRSGVAYRLPVGSDAATPGLLPTVLTSDRYNPTHDELRGERDGYHPQLRAIGGLLPHLPTPKRSDGEFATPSTTGRDHAHATHLATRVVYDVPGAASPDLFPTPQAVDGTGGRLSREGHSPPLPGVVHDLFPTTTARDAAASGGSTPEHVTLTDAVVREELGSRPNGRHESPELLATPIAMYGEHPGIRTVKPGQQEHLTAQVIALGEVDTLLPTPDAYAGERGAGQDPRARRAAGHSVALSDVAEHDLVMLPTVVAHDSGNSPEAHLRKKPGRQTVTSLAVLTEHDLLTRGGNPNAEPEPGSPWGKYAPAVQRWERCTRPAPAPTMPNRNGNPQLSPLFTEWMMGLEPGRVTDPAIGLTRGEQLAACGNGVVPQQAAHAVRLLLARLTRHPLA